MQKVDLKSALNVKDFLYNILFFYKHLYQIAHIQFSVINSDNYNCHFD